MRNIILFDDAVAQSALLPFTFTRPAALIRCGIDTIAEKWTYFIPGNYTFLTAPHLADKYPTNREGEVLYINGRYFPDDELVNQINLLENESVLRHAANNQVIAYKGNLSWETETDLKELPMQHYTMAGKALQVKSDIMGYNGAEICLDFARKTKDRISAPITDRWTAYYNEDQIFIEEGASIKAAILNAENGPIYIGKHAQIQEGASIQGPFSLGDASVIAQGSKIRPNTTIGPNTKVGGEISGCVFFGNANKGHEGYLGNSVIGEWCNLGALTTNSNLKNDFTNVKLFDYSSYTYQDTGLMFCGLFMGDYSKSGIGTLFNTGTVVGVHVNVFGAGLQPKFIPSFTWGGKAEGMALYRLDKALDVAAISVQKKGATFDTVEAAVLTAIFEKERHHIR